MILIDDKQFRAGVIDCLHSQLVDKIKKNLPQTEKQVKQLIYNTINNHPNFIELRKPNSYLAGLLGLTDEAQNGIEEIIREFAKQTQIDFTITKNPLKAKVKISVIEDNYSKLYLMDAAYTTMNSPLSTKSFFWLKMFLEPYEISSWHSRFQINRYESKFFSRSKNAMMIQGGTFVLPMQYAHTMEQVIDELKNKLPDVMSMIYG